MAKKKNKDRIDDEESDDPITRIPLKQLRSERTRKRNTQKTLHKAKIMRENHQKKLANKGCFEVDVNNIRYADNYADADRLADDILRRLQRTREEDVIVGFDTEGSITVLQLFFQINGRDFAQVYQLNKILKENKSPPNLIKLLTDERMVFAGKAVNGEVIEVMRMCRVDEQAIRKMRIVEVQRIFETLEVICKSDRQAYGYFNHGTYIPSYSLPKNPFIPIDKQKQEDLGLDFLFRIFYPDGFLCKLYEMRCPLFIDWSCATANMSTEMLRYGASDAGAGHRTTVAGSRAIERIGMNWTDVVEFVDLEETRNKNGPFNSGQLARFFERAKDDRLSEKERTALRDLRRVWRPSLESSIRKEVDTRIDRHDRYVELQRKWDAENGYPACLDEGKLFDTRTQAETVIDDDNTEFEVLLYEYPLNTEIHRQALLIRSEVEKYRRQIEMVEKGIDLAEEEEKQRKRDEAMAERMRRSFASSIQDPSTSADSAPDDAEGERRRDWKRKEKEADEEDEERFAALRGLKDIEEKYRRMAEEAREKQTKGRQERAEEERKKKEEEGRKKKEKQAEERKKEKEAEERKKEKEAEERKKVEEAEERKKKEREKEAERLRTEKEVEERIRLRKKEAEEKEKIEEERRKEKQELRERERRMAIERKEIRRKEEEEREKEDERRRQVEERKREVEDEKIQELEEDVESAKQKLAKAEETLASFKRKVAARRRSEKGEISETHFYDTISSSDDDAGDSAGDDDEIDDRGDSERSEAESVGEMAVAGGRVIISGNNDDDDGDVDGDVDGDDGGEDDSHIEPSGADHEGDIDMHDVVSEGGNEVVVVMESRYAIEEAPPAKRRKKDLNADTQLLNTCELRSIERNIDCIFGLSKNFDGADYFIDVLKEIRFPARKKRIAVAVKAKLKSPDDRNRFVRAIMFERILYAHYLTTLAVLNHYIIDPIITIDHVMHRNADFGTLTKFVKAFHPSAIQETVKELCKLATWSPENIIRYVRDLPTFPDNYYDEKPSESAIMPVWLLRLARKLCDISGITYPEVVKQFPFRELMQAIVGAFKAGGCETDDFLHEVEAIRALCGVQPLVVVEQLRSTLPAAAKSVAEIHHLPSFEVDEREWKFVDPDCTPNKSLHDLIENIVFFDMGNHREMESAMRAVKASRYIAIKMNVNIRRIGPKETVLITIRADKAVATINLKLSEEPYLTEFWRQLQRAVEGKRILMKEPRSLHEITLKRNFTLNGLVDADALADRLEWPNRTWATLATKLTGGPICRRGGLISGNVKPSLIAIQHEGMRASLIYTMARRFATDAQQIPVSHISEGLRKKRRLESQ